MQHMQQQPNSPSLSANARKCCKCAFRVSQSVKRFIGLFLRFRSKCVFLCHCHILASSHPHQPNEDVISYIPCIGASDQRRSDGAKEVVCDASCTSHGWMSNVPFQIGDVVTTAVVLHVQQQRHYCQHNINELAKCGWSGANSAIKSDKRRINSWTQTQHNRNNVISKIITIHQSCILGAPFSSSLSRSRRLSRTPIM